VCACVFDHVHLTARMCVRVRVCACVFDPVHLTAQMCVRVRVCACVFNPVHLTARIPHTHLHKTILRFTKEDLEIFSILLLLEKRSSGGTQISGGLTQKSRPFF